MFPRDSEFPTGCHKALYFTAHLALCLTHYLGIVFSVLAAVVRLWDRKEDGLKRLFSLLRLFVMPSLSRSTCICLLTNLRIWEIGFVRMTFQRYSVLT